MSNSVNDELEQLLDEWIESIMREVRKAREARLAEIRQEVAAISARLDALEQEFEERRRARNGMQATTEREARTGPELYDRGDKNPVAKEHRGEG
jgi:hypothetical protein